MTKESLRDFTIKEDGLYLTVYPPVSSNGEINLSLIFEEIKLRNIELIDENLLYDAARNLHRPIKIAEKHSGINDALFKLEVTSDEMQVLLMIFPEINDGKKVDLHKIKQELNILGIKHGIIEEAIISCIENPSYRYSIIAKGTEPIDGESAKIEYLFNVSGFSVKFEELEDGRIDFYNTTMIESVKKGDFLARKTPATKGIPGFSVKGKMTTVKSGKDVPLLAGKTVNLSEDGLKLIAEISGHPVLIKNRVSVLTVYEVKGDVDFSTGNINFDGHVIVHGSVKNGFTVNATGDVEVKGNVEAGNIIAKGKIVVKSGIVGMKKSIIDTESDLLVKFIESAQIKVGGNLTVSDAIMHSTTNCVGKVSVGGRKGLIVGGITRAGEEIHAKNLGSTLATTTIIEVGILPELREEYKNTIKKISDLKESLDKTQKAIAILNQIEGKLGSLPADKIEMKSKLMSTLIQLKQEFTFLKNSLIEIDEKFNESEKGIVRVMETVHCGVNIVIGRANTYIKDDLRRATFYLEGLDIKIKDYS